MRVVGICCVILATFALMAGMAALVTALDIGWIGAALWLVAVLLLSIPMTAIIDHLRT